MRVSGCGSIMDGRWGEKEQWCGPRASSSGWLDGSMARGFEGSIQPRLWTHALWEEEKGDGSAWLQSSPVVEWSVNRRGQWLVGSCGVEKQSARERDSKRCACVVAGG